MKKRINLEKIPNQYLLISLGLMVYVDLLFLPYFQYVIMPYSLFLILISTFFCKNFKSPPGAIYQILPLALLMVVSTMLGLFSVDSSGYFWENVKRVVQILSGFSYLFFFYAITIRVPIQRYMQFVSYVFFGYFLLLLVWFFVEPLFVNQILKSVYGRLVTESSDALSHMRFGYLFTDPNTAAYFLLIAVLPWLSVTNNFFLRFAIVILCFMCCILLQSRGALLAFILSMLIWTCYEKKILVERANKISLKVIFWCSVFMFLLILVYIYSDSEILKKSVYRITKASDIQTGGSRFLIWKNYIAELPAWPIGVGYQFTIFNEGFYPHSDIIRLLYSYGFIALGFFLFFFISSGIKFPLLFIPAFFALAINTLIGEQKLLALYFSTIGVFMGIRNLNTNK